MSIKLDYISPWIHTTDECNLKCSYCHVKKGSNWMSASTYQNMTRVFSKLLDSGEVDFVYLRLAGGEPLISYNLWKHEIDHFLRVTNGKGAVNVITNLTLPLSCEQIQFLTQPNVYVSVSLDGILHSKPYPDGNTSSFSCLSNIRELDRDDIVILTTMSQSSLSEIDKLREYIAEKKFPWRIAIDYWYDGNPTPEGIIRGLKQTVYYLYKHSYPLDSFKLDHCDLNGFDEGCKAGQKLFAINTDGGIHVCHTLFSESPIGNISDKNLDLFDLLEEKCSSIRQHASWNNGCGECPAFSICHGDCMLYNNGKRREYFCKIVKEFLPFFIKLNIKQWEEKRCQAVMPAEPAVPVQRKS